MKQNTTMLQEKSNYERLDPVNFIGDVGVHQKTLVAHVERYRLALQFVRDKRVLDIACGIGYGSKMLRVDGGATVVDGVDVAEEAVEQARQRYSAEGISFSLLDANTDTLPNSAYDVVVSFETIEHLASPNDFLHKLHCTLRPGGRLIISTPIRQTTDIDRHHLHDFSRGQFKTMVEGSGFRIESTVDSPLHFTFAEMWRTSKSGSSATPKNLPLFYCRHPLKWVGRLWHTLRFWGLDMESLAIVAEKK